ncbi:MAG: GMC family oxidoreductase [Rhodospirillaceae bacterium]|nr:GMC family oxidoreductase [Rhodospirillales bacterium]
MIIHARDLPADFRLEADIAIVGAGPAGITLAHELMGSGLTVLLLEAGGKSPETTRLDSYYGEVLDPARHPPISLYRVRGLGGTSTRWGGRCIPLDPIDLEARPHIPWSGWPLDYDELKQWYRSAMAYCEAGPFRFRAGDAMDPSCGPMVPGFSGANMTEDALERFSPPTDFGKRYRRAFARSNEVALVLSANCTGIVMAPNHQGVEGLSFATDPGHRFTVKATRYVLAAGALETARLMLAAKAGNDLVGRFYMCHIEGKAAVARFKPGSKIAFQYERDRDGIYVRRHFSIPAEIQRQRGLTNVIMRFEPPVIANPCHGNPVLSAMWLSRTFLKPEYERKMASCGYRSIEAGGRGRNSPGRRALVAHHVRNVVLGTPGLARFGVDWTVRHVLPTRKLPYVAVRGKDGAFTLDYNAEQVPNPHSRVTLGSDTDSFGLPRLVVDWRASAQDVDSVVAAHSLLAEQLEASGSGRLEVDEAMIREGYNATGGHHIGTTRMAGDASAGVVDRHCRVFGVDNLFVTGSAVFTTSGYANPTLTLVALAARLGEHLRQVAAVRSATTATDMARAAE